MRKSASVFDASNNFDDAAEGPDVGGKGVVPPADPFWTHVYGGAYECVADGGSVFQLLADSEVGELHVQLVVKPARAVLLLVGGMTLGIHRMFSGLRSRCATFWRWQ